MTSECRAVAGELRAVVAEHQRAGDRAPEVGCERDHEAPEVLGFAEAPERVRGAQLGDLLFACAGFGWACFGILLRRWSMPGMKAVGAVAAISLAMFAPLYFAIYGTSELLRFGLFENMLQALVQGILAGALPIYLFARSVALLGAGRGSTFPALVPLFGVVIGFLTLGIVPTPAQAAGLAVVLIGFRLVLR